MFLDIIVWGLYFDDLILIKILNLLLIFIFLNILLFDFK
jgi:hypothetical protein